MLFLMFICQICRKIVPAGVSAHKVVTKWRERYYPERRADAKKGIAVHRPIAFIDEKGKKKYRYPSDPGGVGREIDTEVNACPICAVKHEQEQRRLEQLQQASALLA